MCIACNIKKRSLIIRLLEKKSIESRQKLVPRFAIGF